MIFCSVYIYTEPEFLFRIHVPSYEEPVASVNDISTSNLTLQIWYLHRPRLSMWWNSWRGKNLDRQSEVPRWWMQLRWVPALGLATWESRKCSYFSICHDNVLFWARAMFKSLFWYSLQLLWRGGKLLQQAPLCTRVWGRSGCGTTLESIPWEPWGP